ncbi:hypothetical protein SEPCBS57363_005846 [Sporothrix epigloea]|uniref:HypA-like protein n=1 Tax=Sporothrix epigloea TaxID=1892477 RepID=A0ABP0E107_9PEZI
MTPSAVQISIDTDNTGQWYMKQTPEASNRVSLLLQTDLETHHVYFNNSGFHNHIPHHLLSLYGTGADADAILQAYNYNKGYQRSVIPVHKPSKASNSPVRGSLAEDWYETTAPRHLGSESYYPDFLQFFQHEIARRDKEQAKTGLEGWQAVLLDRLFSGTPAAEDLRTRLFAGFLHPLIQLMFGIEWGQPAIVAQGLAQAAIHKLHILDEFLQDAEKSAAASPDKDEPPASILSLFQEAAATPAVSSSAHWKDANKLVDGVLGRAREEMTAIAARVSVPATEEGLAARTAEMAEACVYVAASAALHPTKLPKFDFFLLHHVTSIPFFSALNSFAWVPVQVKARMLEWKIRMDLAQYAARGCPPLRNVEALEAYQTLVHEDATGPTVDASETHCRAAAASADHISSEAAVAAARLFNFDEDGHAIKLVRATALTERLVQQSTSTDFPCRILYSDSVWEALYRLETDSVKSPGSEYVRTAGLEEAWKEIPDRSGTP